MCYQMISLTHQIHLKQYNNNNVIRRGKHISEKNTKYDGVKISIPVDSLVETPGESKSGLYDFETGEIKEAQGF